MKSNFFLLHFWEDLPVRPSVIATIDDLPVDVAKLPTLLAARSGAFDVVIVLA